MGIHGAFGRDGCSVTDGPAVPAHRLAKVRRSLEPPCGESRRTGFDVRTYVPYRQVMEKTATELRAHLYEVLDQVARTGQPVSIRRGDVVLQIVRAPRRVKRRGPPRVLRDLIVGDPDELVHIEWPWSAGKDL